LGFSRFSDGAYGINKLSGNRFLGRIAFKALDDYMTKRKRGENPVFYADDIEGLKGVECWPTREEEQMKKVAGK